MGRQILFYELQTDAFATDAEYVHIKRHSELCWQRRQLKENDSEANIIKQLSAEIEKEKAEILRLFVEEEHDPIRQLRRDSLYYTDGKGIEHVQIQNVSSMFETTLTRSFGIQQTARSNPNQDIFIIERIWGDIFRDLIINGFHFEGRHYIYFCSSAGQIRHKKAVFVDEEKYKACSGKITCGLTIDKINAMGGINTNKFIAYLALANSATDPWEVALGIRFEIDRCIVVEDFKTLVPGVVDEIDVGSESQMGTYEIRQNIYREVEVPHTDGFGMIDTEWCGKNFQVRLPWIKGLLGAFDFRGFIIENDASSKVRDIWGKEYDVFDDDIRVIFTKSQFKMWKFYESWEEYKEAFIRYGCEAGIMKLEKDYFPNRPMGYQMLQTLYDATDEEIEQICQKSNDRLQNFYGSLEGLLDMYDVDLDHKPDDETLFKKALRIYPEVLNDPSSRKDITDRKNSILKTYRSGKLDVLAKNTFILPDVYAFCEWLFMGIKNPKGLLDDGEVFCRLFRNHKKLDCLRSPHLYIEHALRKNVCGKKTRKQRLDKWLCTDGLYTSTKDLISKLLMFDVDGDMSLVVADPLIIKMAERVTQNVRPLYYEMAVTKDKLLSPETIYEGLTQAFKANIGIISNNITKIWSQDVNEQALTAIRWLCAENNFEIDFAKTLYKPERPPEISGIISALTKGDMPYFFQFTKDKNHPVNVQAVNGCTMNRISEGIKDPGRLHLRLKNLGKIDYTMFLGKETKFTASEINEMFDGINRMYGMNISYDSDDGRNSNISAIVTSAWEKLHEIETDDEKILCSIVKHYYEHSNDKKKKLLWSMFGERMLLNLEQNLSRIKKNYCHKCGRRSDEELRRGMCRKCREEEAVATGKKILSCIDCGEEFEVDIRNNRTKRCQVCQAKARSIAVTRSRKNVNR